MRGYPSNKKGVSSLAALNPMPIQPIAFALTAVSKILPTQFEDF